MGGNPQFPSRSIFKSCLLVQARFMRHRVGGSHGEPHHFPFGGPIDHTGRMAEGFGSGLEDLDVRSLLPSSRRPDGQPCEHASIAWTKQVLRCASCGVKTSPVPRPRELRRQARRQAVGWTAVVLYLGSAGVVSAFVGWHALYLALVVPFLVSLVWLGGPDEDIHAIPDTSGLSGQP